LAEDMRGTRSKY